MKKIAVLALAAGLGWSVNSLAQDAAKAEATIKASGCLKCHSVSADKDGPSFKKTAEKYKGKGDAAAMLEGNLKKGMMGKEKHATVKGSDADVKNVVAYILSR